MSEENHISITIDFESEAMWEAADANEITLSHLTERLQRFCNTVAVKRMLLEGTILNPIIDKKELN
jgi:hypothetical protein